MAMSDGFFAQNDYRSIIKAEYEKRVTGNPSYSMRAFARDLDVQSSRLSEVLNGRYGLSRTSAQQIAHALSFSGEQTEFFCDLVECHHGRSNTQREIARLRLSKHQKKKSFSQVEMDSFRFVADWYHNAILELLTIRGARSEAQWLADRLGISESQVEQAIKRLLRLGFLKKSSGRWLPADENTTTGVQVPSDAIRTYHRQSARLASMAVNDQDVDEREFRSLMLAFSKAQTPRAKDLIRNFIREFSAISKDEDVKDSVYALNIQFFKIAEAEMEAESETSN